MIPIGSTLIASLASQYGTFSKLIRLQRKDGTIVGLTDHDANIDFDDGDGVVTYLSAGYRPKDAAQGSDLTVDDSEYDGIATSPSITEADMNAGLWDYAGIRVSYVNWAHPTQGALRIPGWKLGKVRMKRGEFTADIRGIMQAYATTIGELTSPGCRANLGDSRCKVNLAPFTVTGTLTGVSPDQMTLYDTGRAEAGPSGGIAITSITNADPGVITVADVSSFTNGEAVTLADIVGPDLLNANTFVRNINLGANTFELDIDTSDTGVYAPYVSGGTVTPLGGTSGYFDFGVITMTSGLADGFSQDVLAYVPGQWTLQLPFPYAVAISDTYSMVAGCDKSLATCIGRFSNAVNNRSEPYLPGIDRVVQVGKQ